MYQFVPLNNIFHLVRVQNWFIVRVGRPIDVPHDMPDLHPVGLGGGHVRITPYTSMTQLPITVVCSDIV